MIDMSPWQVIVLVAVVALILWLTCKAAIGSYFKAKENFVNRMVDKLRGASNGKE